ncbi:MAG: acetolactate synthase [Methanobacteriaceae archaeon]|jgi:hypothetical protein|nr:acetolactate synthase [Candidatus Methanorudis spinitermitis]
MKIKQLSIFLENKEGRLWNALDILANDNINIRALSLADTSEFGILRIIVQDPEKAKKVLEDNDFIVKIKNVIGVELSDTPGGLAKVLKLLNENKINLEYLYAFTHEKSEKAILLLQANDLDSLIGVLEKNNIKVVPSKEVYNL